jgi:hypothetical protein
VHLRTTKPIESNFATVRHRTKGPGSRAAGLAMAFKLIEATQDRWRAVNAPHLVALVRAGATFTGGKLVERPGEDAQGHGKVAFMQPEAALACAAGRGGGDGWPLLCCPGRPCGGG